MSGTAVGLTLGVMIGVLTTSAIAVVVPGALEWFAPSVGALCVLASFVQWRSSRSEDQRR